jgi:HrpA-like RNA helicase
VPKYLLEYGALHNQEVNIICTQPRRLAAINIAKRVAEELDDQVGNLVGYQVGMDSCSCSRTKVLFMTTGIFLMRLVNNPDSLQKFTHIIMDEVHERDLDIDFSLVVIKHLLAKTDEKNGLRFKLVLMSATFNTELFANYFAKTSVQGVEDVKVYEGV